MCGSGQADRAGADDGDGEILGREHWYFKIHETMSFRVPIALLIQSKIDDVRYT
jgi:hypothetical protein